MIKPNLFLFIALFASLSMCAFGQNTSSLNSVKSFYQYDRSHSQTFSRGAIEARKKWLSPELYRLFRNELKREKAYLKKNPTDKPYFGDGLPFQPIDETCKVGRRSLHKSLTFGQTTSRGGKASVPANFAFPKPCTDPDLTTYTIQLVKTKKGWLVDNVLYEGDRNLVSDLKRKEY